MKTAILLTDGIKQIMFTPENDSEKAALKFFSPNEEINIAVKSGKFSEPIGYSVAMCRGNYLRAFENEDSLMFVLSPKKEGVVE